MSTEQSPKTTASRTEGSTPKPDASPWSPLRRAAFRSLWIALIGARAYDDRRLAEPPRAELP